MKIDSSAYFELGNHFFKLSCSQFTHDKFDMIQRHQKIVNGLKSLSDYFYNVSYKIENTENQNLFKDGYISSYHSFYPHIGEQLLKKSTPIKFYASRSGALKVASLNYTKRYFHAGVEAKAIDGDIYGSAQLRLWKDKMFDPSLQLKAGASVCLFSMEANARVGNSAVYGNARAIGKVGVAYADCKAVFNKSEQSLEGHIGAAALQGEVRCTFKFFGARITLTGEGSILSAEANFSYHHKNREWEFGSKLGFICGLGFKLRINY